MCLGNHSKQKKNKNSYSHTVYILLGGDRREVNYGTVLTNMVINSHVQLLRRIQLI